MKIHIKNYNNIKDLKYLVEDHKINFLIGNSGSGKSSIAKALSKEDIELHIPFNNPSLVPVIEVDDNAEFITKASVFDESYMSNILIQKNNARDIYSILIDDENQLDELRNEYIKAINPLSDVKDKLYELKRNIADLKRDLKIAYSSKNGNYKSDCTIRKFQENVEQNNTDYVKYKHYDSRRIKWFSDGTKFSDYENGKCPFCNRKLSDSRKVTVEKIKVFDAKTYEKINSKNNIFVALGLPQPNWVNKSEVNRFNKQLKEILDLEDEILCGIKYIEAVMDADIVFSNRVERLKTSPTLKRLYPEIAESFEVFNSNYKEIRACLGRIKGESNKLIRTNIKIINEQLEHLGVNYLFKKVTVDENKKEASFIIVHKYDSATDKDRESSLSYGEKNLIGLVLFLCAHSKDDLVIIDDPAGSYDEYRRKVIFDMCYDFIGHNTTAIVISHDPVFAKFAVLRNRLKRDLRTGSIDLLENYDCSEIKHISEKDFKPLKEFIEYHITELSPTEMTYQLASNLRVYYEDEKRKKEGSIIYGYLSAVIHRTDKETIIEQLIEKDYTEKKILQAISKKFDIKPTLSPLSNNYVKEINTDGMTNFEKIIYLRENCSGNGSKRIRDELGNIIHLNNTYFICLNPYKFNYYSEFVHHKICELNTKIKESR